MRVMTLGAVPLPSSTSTLAALRGDAGCWGQVAYTTALRALLVAPGVWVGGGRGWRLVGGSLVASASITAALFAWHALTERAAQDSAGEDDLPSAMPAPGEGYTGYTGGVLDPGVHDELPPGVVAGFGRASHRRWAR